MSKEPERPSADRWAAARKTAANLRNFLSRLSEAERVFEAAGVAEEEAERVRVATKQAGEALEALAAEVEAAKLVTEKAAGDRDRQIAEMAAHLVVVRREAQEAKDGLKAELAAHRAQVDKDKGRLDAKLRDAHLAYDLQVQQLKAAEKIEEERLTALRAEKDRVVEHLRDVIASKERKSHG